jgi:hypothetical protein
MPCHSHPTWLDLTIFGEVKLRSFSLHSILQPYPTSFHLGPNILITLSLCSSLNVRVQVSHPYKTSKIIVLYILSF